MSCPECFSGSIHDHEKIKGKETTIHGRLTYVAEPPSGTQAKGIIIMVPDAFGLPFVNNKILADHYANKGSYKVYLPDFMDGSPAPVWMINTFEGVFNGAWYTKPYHVACGLYGFVPFLLKNTFGKSMPKVTDFFTAVRKNEAAHLPIGVAGFCWGGKHAINLAMPTAQVDGKPLVDAVFTAHPSSLDIPNEFKALKQPVSIAIGDKDFNMSMEQVRQAETLMKKTPGLKSEVVVYEGAGHGFSVRADLADEKLAAHAEEAEQQALKFFADCFAQVKY